MQNTENFNLKVYDGEDLFNPLTVENVNMNAIDTQMKKNENHAVGDATELVSGTVHAITRLTPDAPMLRFTATSRFTAGDTFTVDGVQVSALTVSGEQLPDGAYIIGSEVLAYLKGTLLTVFTSQGTLATAKNALKLGGNDPEYYATASAVQTAQETATAAGNLANEVNNSLGSINSNLTWKELGILTKSNSLTLPTEFNELEIAIRTDDYAHTTIMRISKENISWLNKNSLSNCAWSQANNDNYNYRLSISSTSISLNAAKSGNTDILASTNARVLYR